MASKHILIIDDDAQIRRLYGGKLAASGYEVIYAADGDEGREVARRMQPDLVLLDIHMSGNDGYVIARRLHNEPLTKDIPIVFLTNEDLTPEAVKAVKELGVTEYIHKSVTPGELAKRVKEILKTLTKKKPSQRRS